MDKRCHHPRFLMLPFGYECLPRPMKRIHRRFRLQIQIERNSNGHSLGSSGCPYLVSRVALYVFAFCTVSFLYDCYWCSCRQGRVYCSAGDDDYDVMYHNAEMMSSTDCVETTQDSLNADGGTDWDIGAQMQV